MPKDYKSKTVLSIDKYNLDEECEVQSEAYGHWAARAARAKKRARAAKSELKLTKAETFVAIRTNPAKYGFSSRPSDQLVEMKVETMPEVRQAQRELDEAEGEVDQYEVMTKALDHKKTMLEELAYLDARSYFSRPKTAIHDGRPKMRRRE